MVAMVSKDFKSDRRSNMIEDQDVEERERRSSSAAALNKVLPQTFTAAILQMSLVSVK